MKIVGPNKNRNLELRARYINVVETNSVSEKQKILLNFSETFAFAANIVCKCNCGETVWKTMFSWLFVSTFRRDTPSASLPSCTNGYHGIVPQGGVWFSSSLDWNKV